jgi:hypothetical protein
VLAPDRVIIRAEAGPPFDGGAAAAAAIAAGFGAGLLAFLRFVEVLFALLVAKDFSFVCSSRESPGLELSRSLR